VAPESVGLGSDAWAKKSQVEIIADVREEARRDGVELDRSYS